MTFYVFWVVAHVFLNTVMISRLRRATWSSGCATRNSKYDKILNFCGSLNCLPTTLYHSRFKFIVWKWSFYAGASIPMGQGGHVPQYLWSWASCFVNAIVYYDSKCRLLYFNANIICSFTKKASASGGLPQTSYRGSAPGPRWGTSVPRTPSLHLCPSPQ